MKKSIIYLLFIVILLPACQTPFPETTIVKETVVVEVPVNVEVTRLIEIEVTRELEVTRLIEVEPVPIVPEHLVTTITLAGPIANRNAEISGLAWYGDWLILMPQYPDFAGEEGDGFLYALGKVDILAFLDGEFEALKVQEIPLIAPGLADSVAGYEGFEAIAFNGNTVFMTIEASPREGMRGYLVKGQMAPDLSKLVLDTAVLTPIHPQNDISNKSEEALFIVDDRVATLYETNGTAVNDSPVAHLFDETLMTVGTIPFPHIEYRLTDVTALDDNGRFWAINYFFPGDTELVTKVDSIADQYGQGESHQQYPYVERLVQFQYNESGITLANTPPIQLELILLDARNWEGIVRLDDLGFLLATDKFPTTILGFVATNQ